MAQNVADKFLPYIESLIATAKNHPGLTLATLSVVPVLSWAIPSYRGFRAVGPGGLPDNILGWLIQLIGQPFAQRDVTSLRPYQDPKIVAQHSVLSKKSFLGDKHLPNRAGDRPEIPKYVAPQRQTTEQSTPEMVARMNAYLRELAAERPDLLTIRGSVLEHPREKALWLNVDSNPVPELLLKGNKGELAHVHPEGSTHVYPSLVDAETLVKTGWAQRQMFSGVLLPWTYTLIYGPRNDEEFEIWKGIVNASLEYMAAEVGRKW